MLKNLKIYEKRQRAAEAEIRESELRALRNQINPHFLYNTLNMVRWMARFAGTENIEECVRALGAIITPLYKDDSPTCTLRKEIELLNQYLTIMKFSLQPAGSISVQKFQIRCWMRSFPDLSCSRWWKILLNMALPPTDREEPLYFVQCGKTRI